MKTKLKLCLRTSFLLQGQDFVHLFFETPPPPLCLCKREVKGERGYSQVKSNLGHEEEG